MADEFEFKGTARCVWAEPNNGVIKAILEPETSAAGIEYVIVNFRKEKGMPEVGKTYYVEIRSSLPH